MEMSAASPVQADDEGAVLRRTSSVQTKLVVLATSAMRLDREELPWVTPHHLCRELPGQHFL
jgi:hypothetical protein